MTNEKMTIHKALAELKIIGNRIDGAIDSGIYCKANKHSNEKINGISIEDFRKRVQGDWDRVNDLIKRRNAIKRAVTLSNAITKVKVGGEEYTVAEAIEMKNSGILYLQNLKDEMTDQYAVVLKTLEKENGDELQKKAENYVMGLYGTKESKTSTEEIENTKKQFILNNSFDLIDPIKIKDKIDMLEKEIAEFTADVDSTLSVSNAITEIEINY